MLVCRPQDLLSWTYSVIRDEVVVAEVQFDNPEETGAIRIGDKTYLVANDKSWGPGERKLFAGNSLLATSLKPSMLKQHLVVEATEFTFEMTRAGLFAKKYEIRRGQQILGTIAQQS